MDKKRLNSCRCFVSDRRIVAIKPPDEQEGCGTFCERRSKKTEEKKWDASLRALALCSTAQHLAKTSVFIIVCARLKGASEEEKGKEQLYSSPFLPVFFLLLPCPQYCKHSSLLHHGNICESGLARGGSDSTLSPLSTRSNGKHHR